MIVEKFGADTKYNKGVNNVIAAALSSLPIQKPMMNDKSFLQQFVFKDIVAFPLDLQRIKDF